MLVDEMVLTVGWDIYWMENELAINPAPVTPLIVIVTDLNKYDISVFISISIKISVFVCIYMDMDFSSKCIG
jgi:hypothetical protein